MDSICSLESPPPALSTCGTVGTINPGSTIQPLSGASVVLFPEQCADLCDAAEGCLSFTVIGGQTGPIPLLLASCILYDVAIEDLQFVEVSLSPTTVYDIGC